MLERGTSRAVHDEVTEAGACAGLRRAHTERQSSDSRARKWAEIGDKARHPFQTTS